MDKNRIGKKILEIHDLIQIGRESYVYEGNFPNSIFEILEKTLIRIDKNAEKSTLSDIQKIRTNLNNLAKLITYFKESSLIFDYLYKFLRELIILLFGDENNQIEQEIVRFQYNNAIKIMIALREVKIALKNYKDNTFKEEIIQISKKIKEELDFAIAFENNTQEILQWRKDLALIILKLDLSEKNGASDRNVLMESLVKLMQETFEPFLQIKSSRLRLLKHRFDPALDVNTKDKEILNFPLHEINPLYDEALQELIKNFDFYINAFNLHYPDAFQRWAKKYSSKREIAVFSESLRLSILMDANERFLSPYSEYAIELVNQKLLEWYDALYEAAKTNNPELIYSDVLHNLEKGKEVFEYAHYTLKEKFALNFAVALVKSPVKNSVLENWRKDSDIKFNRCICLIWKSVIKHYDFYQAFLGERGYSKECIRWLSESKERVALVSPLHKAFHEKELYVEIESQLESFQKFNRLKIEECFQNIKSALKKRDEESFKNIFYSGKDQLKYINWQLVDAFYLLATPSADKALSQWKKVGKTYFVSLFHKNRQVDDKSIVSESIFNVKIE